MAKGRKTGGRKAGTPNRVTVEVREALRELAQGLAPRVQGWLADVADGDPGRALDLYLRALEFTVPKMARLAVDLASVPDPELLAEVRRRTIEARSKRLSSYSLDELMAAAREPAPLAQVAHRGSDGSQ